MAVYFIRAGEDGPVKIGYTRNIANRLVALQFMHWARLRVIRVVPDANCAVERWMQCHFRDRHILSNWFWYSDEMLSVMPPDLGMTYPRTSKSNGAFAA